MTFWDKCFSLCFAYDRLKMIFKKKKKTVVHITKCKMLKVHFSGR